MTSIQIELIPSASAQEEAATQKKSLLESSITFDQITFRPSIGLNGFNVASSFDVDQIQCKDLSNEIHQLGVILYPPEMLNEKFLIKLRDCVMKLPAGHPVKRWMKWIGEPKTLTTKEQESQLFLTEILNSQFNLITDIKVKQRIVNILTEIPEATLSEQVLKSYLYLMIGNITRSDNILRKILLTPPRVIWENLESPKPFYGRLASTHFEQLLLKLSRHPADRRSFELFILYLKSFFNQPSLISIADKFDVSSVESKLDLRFTESLAPSFVHFTRLSRTSVTRRTKFMKDLEKFPLEEQSYWFWPFMDIDPLISEALIPELTRVESVDQLWFIYLMSDERLSDVFAKKSGKSFLPARRSFLKERMNTPADYSMALYKLIEIGDINSDLVNKTCDQILK